MGSSGIRLSNLYHDRWVHWNYSPIALSTLAIPWQHSSIFPPHSYSTASTSLGPSSMQILVAALYNTSLHPKSRPSSPCPPFWFHLEYSHCSRWPWSPFPTWTTSIWICPWSSSGWFMQIRYTSWHPCRCFNSPVCGTFALDDLPLRVNCWTMLRVGTTLIEVRTHVVPVLGRDLI